MVEESGRVQTQRRLTLRHQVVIAMAIVLSPFLVLSVQRALNQQQNEQQESYRDLTEGSREGLATVNASLQAARVALNLIAADDRRPSCGEVGDMMTSMELPVRNVLRFDTEGEVVCSYIGEALVGQAMPDPEWNKKLRQGLEQIESSVFPGMALDGPVIWILRSTPDADGTFAGSIGITISLEKLASSFPNQKSMAGLEQALVTVDNGNVVGSEIIERLPLKWLNREATLDRSIRRLVLPQGGRLDVLVLPLTSEGVWMVASSPAHPRERLETFAVLFVPVLAYVAALLAAIWTIDTLVLRWLERLRLGMARTRPAEQMIPLEAELAGAPAELQQLARTFDNLSGQISVQDSDLQQALKKRDGAFRETHHRVKNNLQIMLSMLKLQGRSETDPQIQQALRIAAQRVSLMAAVHHSLLNEANLEDVSSGDLFEAVCHHIQEQQGWSEESLFIRKQVDETTLPSNLAVPLAMFVQESVHLLCPPSSNSAATRQFQLSFIREDIQVRLRLSCDRVSERGADTCIDRNARYFLSAFALQIGGTIEQIGDDLEITAIELTFPLIMDREDATSPTI